MAALLGVEMPKDVAVPLRLYVVRVIREAYVLAEDQEAAEALAAEISRREDPLIEVGSGATRLDGWEPADVCLVYRADDLETTLAQARRYFLAA